MNTLKVNVAGIDPSTIKVNYEDGYVEVVANYNGNSYRDSWYIGTNKKVKAEVKFGILTLDWQTDEGKKTNVPVTIK